jgi:hypothetical protein
MTPTQKAAMEMALEALEKARPLKADYLTLEDYGFAKGNHYAAMAALRAALAEQPREPLFKPLIDQHPGLAEELAEQADDKTDMTIKLPPMPLAIDGRLNNFAKACVWNDHESRVDSSRQLKKAIEAYAREAVRLNMAPLSDEQERFLSFLYGSGEWDGVWFEERHPTKKGAFWWRSEMRRLFPAHGIKGD